MNQTRPAPWAQKLKKQKQTLQEHVTVIGPARPSSQPFTPVGNAGSFGTFSAEIVGDTGAGPDGIVQPSQPAGMSMSDKGPIQKHEGELTLDLGNGKRLVLTAEQSQAVREAQGNGGDYTMCDGGSYNNSMRGGGAYKKSMLTGGTYDDPTFGEASEPLKKAPINRRSLDGGINTTPSETVDNTGPVRRTSLGSQDSKTSPFKYPVDLEFSMPTFQSGGVGSVSSPIAMPTLEGPPPPKNDVGQTSQSSIATPVFDMPTIENKTLSMGHPGAALKTDSVLQGGVGQTVTNDSASVAMPILDTKTIEEKTKEMEDQRPKSAQDDIDAVRTYMRDAMNGMTDADKARADYYLANFDSSSAAKRLALMQRISSDPYMTSGAKRAFLGSLQQSSEIGRGKLASELGVAAMNRADTAATSLGNLANLERSYDDGALSRIADDIGSGATDEQILAKNPDLTPEDLTKMRTSIDQEKAGPVDSAERIGTLFTGGRSMADITADQTLRNAIAKELNVDPGDASVDAEIATRYQSYLNTNKGGFAGNAETLIGDLVDTSGTQAMALSDQALRQNIAGFLQVDYKSTDQAVQTKIDNEIKRRWHAQSMNETDRIFEGYVGTWDADANDGAGGYINGSGNISPEFMDTPGWKEQFKTVISDLREDGKMNPDGTLRGDAILDWPWDDPDTYFNYTDWNGNNIAYAEGAVGKPSDYDDKTIGDYGITQGEADAAWAKELDKERYFDENGKPNVEQFLKNAFPEKFGGPNSAESIEDQLLNDTELLAEVSTLAENWVSGETYPLDDPIPSRQGMPISDAEFAYYTEDGEKVITSKGDKLPAIWTQLSQMFPPAGGGLLTSGQFQTLWKDGKGWAIDDAGNVLNFKEEFQTENKLKQSDKWRLSNDVVEGRNADKTVESIMNGELTDYSSITSATDLVYTKLLEEVPEGNGKYKRTSGEGAGNNRALYTNLDKAAEEGGLVQYDGRLYTVTREINDKGWSKDDSIYTLTDLVSPKKTKTVEASG